MTGPKKLRRPHTCMVGLASGALLTATLTTYAGSGDPAWASATALNN